MPCYSPLQGYRSKFVNKSGKRPIVFSAREAEDRDSPLTLPCGSCLGCKLERSRQWAIRLVHEASMHKVSSFITLTYDPLYMPRGGSLQLRDFQLFMKRLRKRFGNGVRFFHCGEYGSKKGRPHYHAILFGVTFSDAVPWKKSGRDMLYRSKILEELWPYGYSSIGSVTYESCAYVARYILKKVNGDNAYDHYSLTDGDSGEVFTLTPEYITMSRRPGIGNSWIKTFMPDVYPSDNVVLNGVKMRPPKYYDSQYELSNPDDFEFIKLERERSYAKVNRDGAPSLSAIETNIKARVGKLVRNYEIEE